MHPILFNVGPFTLHTYGLMVALGFMAGYTVARGRFADRRIPLTLLEPLVVYVMVAGILGARLLYFLLNDRAALQEAPLSFFRIWEGGLVFYGGFGAALITIYIFSRVKDIRFLSLLDSLVPSLLIAQALGRLGCFAAGCCYGKPTDGPLKVLFTDPESLGPRFMTVHPVQIYESLAVFFLFLGALKLDKKSDNTGALTIYYLLAYSAVRFAMEFLRGDDRGAFIAGLSPAQLISAVMFAAGFGLWVHVRKNRSL